MSEPAHTLENGKPAESCSTAAAQSALGWCGARLKHRPDPLLLADAYADCRTIARRSAGNFYYSFLVLPRAERLAMCALYTFFRLTDDLGDSNALVAERRAALARWREELDRVLTGVNGPARWWRALADTVCRFQVPPGLLHAVIDGVDSDLDVGRYPTFPELYHYCYRVASAVGLACLKVWGVTDPRADLPAEWCGLAFQLTNVLRDVAEDFRRGRIYIPLDELERFGVAEEELAGPDASHAFESLMRFQVRRAHDYYVRSASLHRFLPPSARPVFQVMTDVYRGLLRKIERRPANVLKRRVALSPWHKLALVVRALPTRFAGRAPTADVQP